MFFRGPDVFDVPMSIRSLILHRPTSRVLLSSFLFLAGLFVLLPSAGCHVVSSPSLLLEMVVFGTQSVQLAAIECCCCLHNIQLLHANI